MLSKFLTDHAAQFVVLVTEAKPPPEKIHEALVGLLDMAYTEGKMAEHERARSIIDRYVADLVAVALR